MCVLMHPHYVMNEKRKYAVDKISVSGRENPDDIRSIFCPSCSSGRRKFRINSTHKIPVRQKKENTLINGCLRQ